MKISKLSIRQLLFIFWITPIAEGIRIDDNENEESYNPCCSMPCQHRGVCTPLSNILYECDCVKGYFGKSCEKASFYRWISDRLTLNQVTKQKIALSGKLLWAVINNIPILHDTALRYVYLSGSQLGGFDHQILTFSNDYETLDAFYNGSFSARALPPVPFECPTPLGIKGPKKLPEVEEVYNLLFKRVDFKPCPHGTNLMLATFGQYLSHQFFGQNLPLKRFGDAGDKLSNIYGSDEVTRKALRSMMNGKLKVRVINGEEYPPYLEDTPGVRMVYPELEREGKHVHPKWALGHKLLGMTPLTFTVATIWLREHNRVCDIILKEHPDWSDERIYKTVRWIMLGELLTITASEYFQYVAQYRLKFGYKPQLFHDVSVITSGQMQYQYESSLIYQWHQTMPDVISIGEKNYNLTNLMFGNNRIVFEHGLDAIVDAMSRNPAGQITFQNCGEAAKERMKNLILEGRRMRLHSFNDYRRFFDLKPYDSFVELVGDREIADTLEDLYGDIEGVEFVVGVFLEKHSGSVIPPTMIFLAGPVALKGVMGSPLGSSALWRPSTFGGKTGFDIVQKATLQRLFCLNLKGNCKNNVWVSFRTPADMRSTSRKHF